jgi:hypothetical protein
MFLMAAMICGEEPVRTWDRSSSKVTSRHVDRTIGASCRGLGGCRGEGAFRGVDRLGTEMWWISIRC